MSPCIGIQCNRDVTVCHHSCVQAGDYNIKHGGWQQQSKSVEVLGLISIWKQTAFLFKTHTHIHQNLCTMTKKLN